MQEWYEEYKIWKGDELHCSLPTFLRVYKDNWVGILKIRPVHVHAPCHQCSLWREYRKTAKSRSDFERINKGHSDHLNSVFMDRAVDARLEALGEQSTKAGEITLSESSILDVCGDGADQAKHRLPRNFTLTKFWDKFWRPQLHVVGNMISSLCVVFYVSDIDVPKDTNLACTCWSRTLEIATKILQERDRQMPDHMRWHTDNAASEGKNITNFCLSAWLVWNGAFKSCDNTQFTVGHTHNKQDQRIGVMCTGLARQSRLEDPDDVVECIRKARCQSLHCEFHLYSHVLLLGVLRCLLNC